MKETCLQKLFSTFPSEWPGVGLLLLRALVACSLFAQGVGYLSNENLLGWGLGVLSFAGGAFLLAGLMTPFVAVLVAAGGIAITLSGLFDSYFGIINQIVLAIAIALLGPGAFSLDARMFGRREITIPVPRSR